MKRVIGILSALGILCSLLLTGVTVSASSPQYQLNFTPTDMVYDTTNNVWAKAEGDLTCVNYPGYAVVNKTTEGGAAAIRKFVAPAAGTLQFAWGGGVYIDNGQGNLTGATVDFAITDGDGKILFPTNGDVASVTEGTPLEVSLTLDNVAAGDEFYFVVNNPSVNQLVCVLNFGVILAGNTYSNGSGFLYDGSTQGGNGWYHQYAATVTKTTAEDAENTLVAFDFTEQEMDYQSAYSAWGVDGNILTGSWSNWGYVDQTNANIRKLVMPQAGTLTVKTEWGATGVTTDAGKSFDFAILNGDKKIIWPTTGGMATVDGSTPALVDLELTVEQGDAIYFVYNNGSTVPTPYYTSSVIFLNGTTRLDNGSGGHGAADISAQGNGGWYYLYASDLTGIKAKDYRDMSALEAALTAAGAYTDLSGYTPASAATFTAALTAAQAITTANSQTEIDAAAAALTAAINGLTVQGPSTILPPEDPADPTVALTFTEKEMDYQSAYSAWGVDGNILTGSWSNWGYVDQTYANIRKLVLPQAGTLTIKTEWGATGVTTEADKSFKFAVLNKDKKIIWPTTGGLATVDGSTPALVDVELSVQAGDAVYFVFVDASATPTPYYTSNVIMLGDSTRLDNGSGGYGAADISAQGNAGWYYLYADDLAAVKQSAYRDMSALNAALAAAGAYSDLSGYTPASAATFTAALTAAQAITTANSQTEIDAAAAALTAAMNGLVENDPEAPLPTEDPADPTVALTFTEQLMTYSSALSGWTADDANNCVIYPWASVSPKQNAKVAIRKFVAPASGDLILAWGNGVSIDKGSANFVITDKYGKIVYPENGGKVVLTAGTPHVIDHIFEDVAAGDVFYFVAYNHTLNGAVTTMHSAVNIDSTAYAENGNFASSANEQGANGWYYVYATDLAEVKKSQYKTFVALNEQIAAAKAIPATTLALYSNETVTAFTAALAKAESMTEANAQSEIDAATAALAAAIKALVPKATASDVTKVTFTEKEMTFNAATGYWSAASDPACILTAPLNYPTPVTGSNTAVVRKLVMPQSGSLELKWGNGVYIDNTSGYYTGATAEFVIADKAGNILYPANGGVAVIKEGTPLVLEHTIADLAKGDEIYFITFNPSMANVPVVYNFAVMLNGTTSLQNEGGSLYGTANEQGNGGWYFGYATDLAFTSANAGGNTGSGSTGNGGAADTPDMGDHSDAWLAGILLVLATATLVLSYKFRKGEGRA